MQLVPRVAYGGRGAGECFGLEHPNYCAHRSISERPPRAAHQRVLCRCCVGTLRVSCAAFFLCLRPHPCQRLRVVQGTRYTLPFIPRASVPPRQPQRLQVPVQSSVITTSCAHAAHGGHLEVLRWARENDCLWDEDVCAAAARSGHLEVIQWAREHGALWNEDTCTFAAQGGHLEVLQWAREHDCPWGGETCGFAAMGGQLAVMQWAREHGAPWDEAYVREHAASGGHQEKLARWLAEHGEDP